MHFSGSEGTFRVLRAFLGHSGPFWAFLGLPRAILGLPRAVLGLRGPFWAFPGPFWASEGRSGPTWANVAPGALQKAFLGVSQGRSGPQRAVSGVGERQPIPALVPAKTLMLVIPPVRPAGQKQPADSPYDAERPEAAEGPIGTGGCRLAVGPGSRMGPPAARLG